MKTTTTTTTNLLPLTAKQLTALRTKSHRKELHYLHTLNANTIFSTDLDVWTCVSLHLEPQNSLLTDSIYTQKGVLDQFISPALSLQENLQKIQAHEYKEVIKLDNKQLTRLLNNASSDRTRPHLNAAYFDTENNKIVSTSGVTMYFEDVEFCADCSPILMPVGLLKKAASYSHATFYYSNIGYMKVEVSDSSTVFYSSAIGREFPRYQAIIPTKSKLTYGQIDLSASQVNEVLAALKLEKGTKLVSKKEGSRLEVQNKSGIVLMTIEHEACSEVVFGREILEAVLEKNTSAHFALTGELSVALVNNNWIAMPMRG